MSIEMSVTKLETGRAGPTADVTIAPSARVLGSLHIGVGAYIAQGAVVRSLGEWAELGSRSALLENGVVISSPELPVRIGQKTVFGHRCLVIGATVSDLCEIGNGSILLPGAALGRRCFLGEGTLIPPGMMVPDDTVLVGRPASILRKASPADLERLAHLRDGDLSLPNGPLRSLSGTDRGGGKMGQLYAFQDKLPQVATSAYLFSSPSPTAAPSIAR